MIALAGYTGFVGSNIYVRASNRIDGIFNTQNIEKAYGLEPDVLIFAGLKPDRRLAERAPYQHLEMVLAAQETIKKINPYKLVLISSTEVYKNPVGVDEENSVFAVGSDKVDKKEVLPYNLNRYYFEEWARKYYPNALILRLATPYGLNFKHNRIKKFADERAMQEIDSTSTYQFYPLSRIWEDIQTALAERLTLVNFTSEPITAGELYRCLTGKELHSGTAKDTLKRTLKTHDVMSVHASKFGGSGNYICTKSEILGSIRQFADL